MPTIIKFQEVELKKLNFAIGDRSVPPRIAYVRFNRTLPSFTVFDKKMIAKVHALRQHDNDVIVSTKRIARIRSLGKGVCR